VDDLEEIVFVVFEDHVDAAVLEDGLDVAYNVWVVQLGAEAHFTDG